MAKKIKKKHTGWSQAQVDRYETDDLVAMLADIGVDIHRERFLKLASAHVSTEDLAWEIDSDVSGEDGDLLTFAVRSLWARWLPERPSVERIEQWIDEGFRAPRKELAPWLKAWSAVRPRIPPEATTLKAAEKAMMLERSLDQWTRALLVAHELDAMDRVDERLAWIEFLLGQFREEKVDYRWALREVRVRALSDAGRREEAYAEARAMIAEQPEEPEGFGALAFLLAKDGDAAEKEALERQLALMAQAIERLKKGIGE